MPRSADTLAVDHARPRARIALIGDRLDWHARGLMKALTAHGVRAQPIRLEDCRIETASATAVAIPGFEPALPDAVIVRSMSGGSFEAVTLRLGILHALRELGIVVWNDARSIERCVDKSMTSFLLARAGIPTPPTWALESHAEARAIVARETRHGPLVLKPLFGSQGRGLRLIREEAQLPPPESPGVYYLQRFVGVERTGGFQDYRLLVVNGRVLGAMMRHAVNWVTNVKQGGRPVPVVPDPVMRELAVRAAAAVGANFAGVDVIYDAGGRPLVLEVNSMPAWSGLQRVTRTDIAATLAADLVTALAAGKRQEIAR